MKGITALGFILIITGICGLDGADYTTALTVTLAGGAVFAGTYLLCWKEELEHEERLAEIEARRGKPE